MSESRQHFRYHDVTLYRQETLGSGSYGIVCKAKCDQLICAAKIMHTALFRFGDPSTNTLLTKFKQECSLLNAAKHPNIVQYIHTYQDPESGLPILLMELCDESLTKFLERSENQLPHYLELDFSTDIALALCYLHANGVIHRDLTSNNVLLIGGCRAKVTDFGMSKLVSVNPRMTPLSVCPGNMLYMSPEAIQQPPRYSNKLDCFSWGVLAIQIMTRLFPDPGPQFNTVEEANGRIVHEVIPEVKRRESHINLVSSDHPLLPLARKCLSYNEKDRPSALQLCELLGELKQLQHYLQSKEMSLTKPQSQPKPQPVDPDQSEELERAMDSIQKLSRQLRAKDRDLQDMRLEVARVKKELVASERYAEEFERTLAQRDETILDLQRAIEQQQEIIKSISLKVDGSESPKTPSPHGSPLLRHDSLMNGPLVPPRSKQSLAYAAEPPSPLQKSSSRQSVGSLHMPSGQERRDLLLARAEQNAIALAKQKVMTFNILRGDKAPDKMSRGAVVTYANIAYFAGFGSPKIHAYQRIMGKDKWTTLPKGPHVCFSLAIINGFITMIGGCKSLGSDPTNTLLSLTTEGSKKKWLEVVPPMPTSRQETAVVSTQQFLVVMGGRGKGGVRLDTVEVLKLETKQWQVAGGLPIALTRPSATICGDDIFIGAGSPSQGSASKAIYSASLTKLLSPYYTFPRSGVHQLRCAWRELASIPADNYTLCTLGNKLVSIGGIEMSFNSSTAIRKYDSDRNEWEVVGHTYSGRCLSLTGCLPGDILVVVGGMSRDGDTNTVEIAAVSYS